MSYNCQGREKKLRSRKGSVCSVWKLWETSTRRHSNDDTLERSGRCLMMTSWWTRNRSERMTSYRDVLSTISTEFCSLQIRRFRFMMIRSARQESSVSVGINIWILIRVDEFESLRIFNDHMNNSTKAFQDFSESTYVRFIRLSQNIELFLTTESWNLTDLSWYLFARLLPSTRQQRWFLSIDDYSL